VEHIVETVDEDVAPAVAFVAWVRVVDMNDG
jgi:hypothetical protein